MASMTTKLIRPPRPSIGPKLINTATRFLNIIAGRNCGTNWDWIPTTALRNVMKMKKSSLFTTRLDNAFGGMATLGSIATLENRYDFWQTCTSPWLHVTNSTGALSPVQCNLYRADWCTETLQPMQPSMAADSKNPATPIETR